MEFEFKGTKGKWEVEEDSTFKSLHGIWSYNHEGFPTYIAKTCSAPASKANALLMSKAPEMLEMLKKLRKEVDWGYSTWGNDKGFMLSEEIEQLTKSATEI